jgi:uncharacterized protein (TIGR03437 family)
VGRIALLVCLLAHSPLLGGQARVDSLSPAQGPIAGGTTVKLTGAGLTGTKVTLDRTAITPVSVSDSQIVFQTPKHDNGIAPVQVSGNGPNAYTEFLYLPPALKDLPPGYITTVMGMGTFRGNGRQATKAVVDAGSAGLAIAPDGAILISEPNFNTIRRVRPDGVIEAFAGSPGFLGCCGGYGDGGPALAAAVFHPRGIAFDASGNLFFADTINLSSIRRIDAATGIITTVIGGPTAGGAGDGGPASQALLNQPLQIAFDGAGNLYILECGGSGSCTQPRIRKVDTKGIITTIGGTGVAGFSGDGGPALNATFNVGNGDNGGLAADASGNVFLADQANGRIRRIDAQTGIITTFATDVGWVAAVATDSSGNVYVGNNNFDSPLGRILKFSPSGTLLQSWGKGLGFAGDGALAVDAALGDIARIQVDASGSVVFAEYDSSRLRRIDASTGQLWTVAGMGPHIIGETGPALATVLGSQGGLAFAPDGGLLVADGGSFRLRKIDALGNVSDVAGDGLLEFTSTPAQVPALQAHICPLSEAFAPNGDLYVSNYNGAGIVRVDSGGTLYAVTAGGHAYSGDGGPAIAATVNAVWDVAVDAAGNVYIADSNSNRIRRIDARTGIITSVAGSNPPNEEENYGQGRYCGDGGPATSACLDTPYGLAVAPDGTLYIGENGQRIRKVDSSGVITTFFSNGGWTLRLHSGNVFTPPYRIQPNGHSFQFAGINPSGGDNGDGGPASQASLGIGSQGRGTAIDSEGNLFLSELNGLRVRAIRFGAVVSEPGSSVAPSGGTPQSAATGRAFPVPLQVRLTSPVGTLENGIRVDFVAPISGPSCVFPGGGSTYSTLTDVSGNAAAVCTANSRTGAYAVTATPLNLGHSATFSLANSAAPPPKISGNGIVNGASFDTSKLDRIAPGALISIFGTGLATLSGVQTARTLPVPTQLGGTQVLINGVAAPIFAVIGNPSFDQINAQVPFEIAGATTGNVVVRVTGQPDSVSEPVAIDPVSPAIFTTSSNGHGPAAIQHSANFALVTSASPAKPGEAVIMYCTGLGVTTPPASTGDRGSPAEPFNRTLETPVVTIGGQTAQVLFSGAAPCCAALYQVNLLVPAGTPAGDQPLVMKMPISNVASRSGVTMNVQP